MRETPATTQTTDIDEAPVMLRSAKLAETVASIMAYSICSMGMIILNKLILFSYNLNYPVGLLFIQNSGAVLLVVLGKQMKWLSCPDFSVDVAKRWLPLTLLFVAMLWTSLKSLHTMSVPVQSTIKNLAVILIAFGDSYFFKKEVTILMYVSFLLMVLGSYMGAKGDAWVTAGGLFWTFANIVSTVSYTLYMKSLLSVVGKQIGKFGPVFYNNLLSLPFLLIAGAPSMVGMLTDIGSASIPALLCLTSMVIVGSMMTFAVFWCMRETSPTTFSVVGAVNKAPLAIAGMVIFDQFPTAVGFFGISVAIAGGFLYTYTSISTQKKNAELSQLITASVREERQDSSTAADEKV